MESRPAQAKKATLLARDWVHHLQSQDNRLQASLPKLNSNSTRRRIHDTRVLTRRLRAALAALGGTKLRKTLRPLRKAIKNLGRTLGPIRGLDVSSTLLKDRLAKLPPRERAKLEPALKILQGRRKAARKSLAGKARKRKPLQEIGKFQWKDLLKELDSPQFLASLEGQIARESADLLVHWRDFEKTQAIASLHQVRIHLKKWRYLQEIRNFLHSQKIPLEKVKELQDELGAIHDLQVLAEELSSGEIRRALRVAGGEMALGRLVTGLFREIQRRSDGFRRMGNQALFSYLTRRFS